jgi:hypothetical protein
MKKQCEGYITLFDEHSNCMQSRPYTSFEDRIGILNEWKKHFHHSNGYFYQIEPVVDDIVLSITTRTDKRARIWLKRLNEAI